jgi:hypothetical protein
MKRAQAAFLILACALSASPVSARANPGASAKAKPTSGRQIAVAQFSGENAAAARSAVLAMLADHDDVAVISLDDLKFAGQRLKADVATPAGRVRLSTELHVDLWLDGEIDGEVGHVTLSTPDGARVATAEARATANSVLTALLSERMWAAMGPRLSPREGVRRRLLDQTELARTKLQNREREKTRQRMLVKERAAAQVAQLKTQRALARAKLAARTDAAGRQAELVLTHKAELLAEQTPKAQPAAARSSAVASASAPASVASVPTAEPAPNNGLSPATQRWLASQQYGAPQQPSAAQPQAYAAQPQPARAYPVAPASPGYAANSGISPATQRWLAAQQVQ